MENFKPEVSIHIRGGRHDYIGLDYISELKKNTLSFFIKREPTGQTNGINLFFFEAGDADEDHRRSFLDFSRAGSFLEAHLQAGIWVYSNHTRVYPSERLRRLKNEVLTEPGDDLYFYRRLAMLDELKEWVDLKVDKEFYPDSVAKSNKQHSEESTHYRNIAVDYIFGGKTDRAIPPYYQSLVTEAILSRTRHRAVTARVSEYIGMATIDLPLRVYVSFGSGHVQGLARSFQEYLSSIRLSPTITTSYASGDSFSHRYDSVTKMEYNPKYRPDDKKLILGMLEEIFLEIPSLDNHPLVNALSYAQRENLTYNSLNNLSQKELDRIIRKLAQDGSEQALTKLLQTHR